MTTVRLWDLAAAEDDRRFTDNDAIGFSVQPRVPAVDDGGKRRHDSRIFARLHPWLDRMLALFSGHARAAKGFPV